MKIKYALVGGGYVLQVLAQMLPADEFVITSRNLSQVKQWQTAGWQAEQLDFSNLESLKNFLEKYSDLQCWIDSVPPFSGISESINYFKQLSIGSKIKRVFYLSTTGVYGAIDGSWVNEQTPLNPQHTKAHQRVLAENLYRSSAYSSSALRISGIYGPGRGAGIALQNGTYPLVDGGKAWSNRIHVYDLASSIQKLITLDSSLTLPAAINLSDDQPALVQEVVEHYCQKFNFNLPSSISKAEAENRGIFTVLGNQRVSNKLLHQTIGYTFKYPSYLQGAGTEFDAAS